MTVRLAKSISSQINGDVALGLAAAGQHVSDRGRVKRVWPVTNPPCHKPGLTCMADAGAARPPHWYVARFSKLEKALERWIPTDIQAAPGERDQRPHAGRAGRHVRLPAPRLRDAGRNGRTRAENLGVDAICADPPAREAKGRIVHESGRPAYVEVAIAWYPELLEATHVQMPQSVKFSIQLVFGGGRTVPDVAVAVDQSF